MPQFLITQFSVADSFLKERKKRRKKKKERKKKPTIAFVWDRSMYFIQEKVTQSF